MLELQISGRTQGHSSGAVLQTLKEEYHPCPLSALLEQTPSLDCPFPTGSFIWAFLHQSHLLQSIWPSGEAARSKLLGETDRKRVAFTCTSKESAKWDKWPLCHCRPTLQSFSQNGPYSSATHTSLSPCLTRACPLADSTVGETPVQQGRVSFTMNSALLSETQLFIMPQPAAIKKDAVRQRQPRSEVS